MLDLRFLVLEDGYNHCVCLLGIHVTGLNDFSCELVRNVTLSKYVLLLDIGHLGVR